MCRWTGSVLAEVMAWHMLGTIADLLLIVPLGTNFTGTRMEIQYFSFMKMQLKMSSAEMITILSMGRSVKSWIYFLWHLYAQQWFCIIFVDKICLLAYYLSLCCNVIPYPYASRTTDPIWTDWILLLNFMYDPKGNKYLKYQLGQQPTQSFIAEKI